MNLFKVLSYLHLSIDSIEVIHHRGLCVKLHVLVGCLLLIIWQEEIFQLLFKFRLGLWIVVHIIFDLLRGYYSIRGLFTVTLTRDHQLTSSCIGVSRRLCCQLV